MAGEDALLEASRVFSERPFDIDTLKSAAIIVASLADAFSPHTLTELLDAKDADKTFILKIGISKSELLAMYRTAFGATQLASVDAEPEATIDPEIENTIHGLLETANSLSDAADFDDPECHSKIDGSPGANVTIYQRDINAMRTVAETLLKLLKERQ